MAPAQAALCAGRRRAEPVPRRIESLPWKGDLVDAVHHSIRGVLLAVGLQKVVEPALIPARQALPGDRAFHQVEQIGLVPRHRPESRRQVIVVFRAQYGMIGDGGLAHEIALHARRAAMMEHAFGREQPGRHAALEHHVAALDGFRRLLPMTRIVSRVRADDEMMVREPLANTRKDGGEGAEVLVEMVQHPGERVGLRRVLAPPVPPPHLLIGVAAAPLVQDQRKARRQQDEAAEPALDGAHGLSVQAMELRPCQIQPGRAHRAKDARGAGICVRNQVRLLAPPGEVVVRALDVLRRHPHFQELLGFAVDPDRFLLARRQTESESLQACELRAAYRGQRFVQNHAARQAGVVFGQFLLPPDDDRISPLRRAARHEKARIEVARGDFDGEIEPGPVQVRGASKRHAGLSAAAA